jgi:hypothetical protein
MNEAITFLDWLAGSQKPVTRTQTEDELLWKNDLPAYKKKFPQYFPPNVPFDVTVPKEAENGSTDPMRVIVEAASLNMGKVANLVMLPPKKFEFRPQTWQQFIGQEDAKTLAQTIIIPQFKRGIKSHLIL